MSSPPPSKHGVVWDFVALPVQVWVLLVLVFLNSYRSFGLRFVQYQYLTNEFGLSDERAASVLGFKATLDVIFGLCGAVLTDRHGVRVTALWALSLSVVARSLICLAKARATLFVGLVGLSPLGEALLSVGLYRVALKRFTTPRTRALGFAVEYATFNLSGAVCDVVIDVLRRRAPDYAVGPWNFSATRLFLLTTLVAVLVSLPLAYCFLDDVTVLDATDPEDHHHHHHHHHHHGAEQEQDDKEEEEEEEEEAAATPVVPVTPSANSFATVRASHHAMMTTPTVLYAAVPTGGRQAAAMEESRSSPAWCRAFFAWRAREGRRFTVVRTATLGAPRCRAAASAPSTSFFGASWADASAAVRDKAFWRVVAFSLSTFGVAKQWSESEQLMPPFLERHFGEKVPIYTIHSINLWGCLLLPPLVGATTSSVEAFRVIMPGLWIMAASPAALVASPTPAGAATWQVLLTIGEVLWSPRQSAWAVTLAPPGREAIFLALSSLKDLLMTWPSTYLIGVLNTRLNPNCPKCRDIVGHFCSVPTAAAATAAAAHVNGTDGGWCASVRGSTCHQMATAKCVDSCVGCPGWRSQARELWVVVCLMSLTSPVLVWLMLPFLRQRHGDDTGRKAKACLFSLCGMDAADALKNDDPAPPSREPDESAVDSPLTELVAPPLHTGPDDATAAALV